MPMRGTVISFAWIVTFQKFSSLQNVRCLSLSQLQQRCEVTHLAAFYSQLSAPETAVCREESRAVCGSGERVDHTNGAFASEKQSYNYDKSEVTLPGFLLRFLAFLWKNSCFGEEEGVCTCLGACVCPSLCLGEGCILC